VPIHCAKSDQKNVQNNFLFMAGKNITTTRDSGVWFIDSGATQDMKSSKKFMSNFKIISPIDIHLAVQRIV